MYYSNIRSKIIPIMNNYQKNIRMQEEESKEVFQEEL
jgi:hypothetical protein